MSEAQSQSLGTSGLHCQRIFVVKRKQSSGVVRAGLNKKIVIILSNHHMFTVLNHHGKEL